jgi:hypothetical protein
MQIVKIATISSLFIKVSAALANLPSNSRATGEFRRPVKTTPHPRRRGGQSAPNESRESLTSSAQAGRAHRPVFARGAPVAPHRPGFSDFLPKYFLLMPYWR